MKAETWRARVERARNEDLWPKTAYFFLRNQTHPPHNKVVITSRTWLVKRHTRHPHFCSKQSTWRTRRPFSRFRMAEHELPFIQFHGRKNCAFPKRRRDGRWRTVPHLLWSLDDIALRDRVNSVVRSFLQLRKVKILGHLL